jgi:hypothetical protein
VAEWCHHKNFETGDDANHSVAALFGVRQYDDCVVGLTVSTNLSRRRAETVETMARAPSSDSSWPRWLRTVSERRRRLWQRQRRHQARRRTSEPIRIQENAHPWRAC